MLHQSAVPVALLDVLESLREPLDHFHFALAGGTSLALRLGHRLSVDLDFFTTEAFEPAALAERLGLGPDAITAQAKGTLQVRLQQIKVEFLKHAYPKLAEDQVLDGIRMWSLEDVIAMKLNAVSNRGSKKDFFDIATLLRECSLQEMLDLYQAKYQPASLLMVIRSLAWFDDADAEPDPISLRNDTWPVIKARIASAIRTLE